MYYYEKQRNRSPNVKNNSSCTMILLEPAPNGVELAFGKVAELVKSFEHVNEILDGFRYQLGDYLLNSTPLGLALGC